MAYNYAYGRFPAPNNTGMMNPPPNIQGPPVFNNNYNNHSWGPRPQRPRFNINSFMLPPHVTQMPNFQPNNMFNGCSPNQAPPRQHFTPDNTFSQGTSNGPHENFPFNNNNGSGFQNNGKHFQHQRGRGRGFMGGHPRGQGFRGDFHGGKHNGNHNNFNNKKKEKVNKRDLAQNNVYFCDTCDRGFKTLDKYQEHVAEHIKCSYKDCPYIAAPKLVHLHTRMQHSTGLAKVWDVKSAEEIKKWREERKKNFPTAENVAKKKQETQDRIARGEVLHTKNFGKMYRGRGGRGGRGHRGRGRGRWRGRWRDYDNADREEDFPQAIDDNDSDSPPEEILITKSTGDEDLGQLGEAAGTEAEVDADTPAIELQAHVPAMENGKLQLLLTSYGESTSDSEASGDDCSDDSTSGDEQSPVGTDTKPATQSTVSPSKLVSPQKPTVASSDSEVSSSSCTTPFVEAQKETTTQNIASSLESSQPAVNGVGISSVQKSGSPHKSASHDASPQTSSADPAEASPTSVSGQHQKLNNHQRGPNDKGHKGNQGNKRAPGPEQGHGPPSKKKKDQASQPVHKYTLLEKLLAPDMRRERNKVLQCAHYIVKNRFFD